MGILFAPASLEQQHEHSKRPSAAVEAKGWQPGDPIRFDEPEPLVEGAVEKQEKLKGKHAADPHS